MTNRKFLVALLGVVATGVANAGDVLVAEFRADREMFPSGSSAVMSRDYDLYRPGNLYTEEIGGTQAVRTWSMGKYTFSSVMDWGSRSNDWLGEPYSGERFFSLGSKFLFGDSSETYLYYGYGRDHLSYTSPLYGGFGDAQTTRTGLSQILYFADRRARIGVGYEHATGDRSELYQGLDGHEVNVSGQVQIGWGFNALLEARYGLFSYGEYDSMRGDLDSARTNMRAGIHQLFTPSLSWGLHYSYIDEDFGLSELSQRRQSWGLNLKYRY